ncbi:tumor necrosis factor ligand superfamily member 13B [Spea bombifrons]|uniref:tumor necrosis factor ligand superfamily member 13B n=1 Tax=Spea bombifrons TaxID=233779 RepID=UPI00234B01DF|nr:tumor necrosis factor ligand superfamily member 13B [Spea bombifrons]
MSIYALIEIKEELAKLQTEFSSNRNRDGIPQSVSLMPSDTGGASGDFRAVFAEIRQKGKRTELNQDVFIKSRSQRSTSEANGQVFQSFLQLIADRKRTVKDEDDSSIIPWLLSLKQGTAMEEKTNTILIKETGYFFIYGQVWYTDELFAMGHLIQRKKVHKVGDDPISITLFRCIQNMPEYLPNNSCFTAGIAKLEEGDELQLIIPRNNAKISLSGDGTFFGAIRLL